MNPEKLNIHMHRVRENMLEIIKCHYESIMKRSRQRNKNRMGEIRPHIQNKGTTASLFGKNQKDTLCRLK